MELLEFLGGSIAPKFFERVKIPRRFKEDMHHDVDIIEQNPFPSFCPFAMPRFNALFKKAVINGVGDSLHMYIHVAADYNEIVTYAGYAFNLEDFDIVAFLGKGEFARFAGNCKRCRFQSGSLLLLTGGFQKRLIVFSNHQSGCQAPVIVLQGSI